MKAKTFAIIVPLAILALTLSGAVKASVEVAYRGVAFAVALNPPRRHKPG